MSNGDTALHSALRSFDGDTSPVKSLLEHDAGEVNVRNVAGETPLLLAVRGRRYSSELIALLLEYGADAKATTPRDGNTALHWLVTVDYYPDLEIDIKILMEHGSDINAGNLKGSTPVHLAAQNECRLANFSVLYALLRYKCDVDISNLEGDTSLHLSLRNNKAAGYLLLQMFLKHAKDVNIANSKGETPLHLVVRKEECCKVKYIKMLLKHGADVSRKDSMGENVYQAYCRALDEDNRRADSMLQILLQSNEQQHMNSSLHVACLFHNVKAVHELLKMGADVHATGDFDFPPLFYALNATGDVDKYSTVRLMLDYGVDINYQFTNKYDGIENTLLSLGFYQPGGFWSVDEVIAMENIFLEHLAKLFALSEKQIERGIEVKELGLYKRELSDIAKFEYRKYEDCFSRCSKELKEMSQTEIGETKVTFLDLLLASVEETAIYAKNKVLVKAFQENESNFPMYHGMMDAKLARELERRKLIERAAVVLSNALNFADPSDEFFERTLSYCSNKDLMSIIDGLDEI